MDFTEKFEKMTEGQKMLRETNEKKWTCLSMIRTYRSDFYAILAAREK